MFTFTRFNRRYPYNYELNKYCMNSTLKSIRKMTGEYDTERKQNNFILVKKTIPTPFEVFRRLLAISKPVGPRPKSISNTTASGSTEFITRLASAELPAVTTLKPAFSSEVAIKDLKKELLVSHFESNRIQTRNYFGGNILLHPAFKHLGNYLEYPNANKTLDLVFFLGCSPLYTKEVLEYIETIIKKFITQINGHI